MILEVAADEAVKALVAGIAGAASKWTERLLQTMRHRIPTGADGPARAELTGLVLERMRTDPQFYAEVTAGLALVGTGPAEDRTGLLPKAFFDRDQLRAELSEPGAWLIAGGGGTGKTDLLAQASLDVSARFPIRAYVNLDEFRDGNALALAEVKRRLLWQIGVEDQVASEAELHVQYVTAVLERRAVLMIDNVVSSHEAEALVLPWPQSLVLVTTRDLSQDLRAWSGATRQTVLTGLDDDGAWQMLALACRAPGMLDAEPAATREVLARCDRLPEAIRQIGAALSRRSGEPGAVAEVLKEYDSVVLAEAVVDRCLAGAFERLSPAAVRAASLLTLHPGAEFGRASAAALLDEPVTAVLDELTDACLVVNHGGGRFQLLRIAARYAALRLPRDEPERDAAYGRVLRWYRDRAVAADVALGERLRRYPMPNGLSWDDPHTKPLDWIVREAGALAELVGSGRDRGCHVEVGQLTGAFEVLLINRGHHQLCASVFERASASAHVSGNVTLEARLYALLGRVHMLTHRFEPAQAAFERALTLLGTIDDPEQFASTYEFCGRLAEERADYDPVPDYGPAIAWMTRAATIDADRLAAGEQRAALGLGIHERMLANLLVKAGDIDSARRMADAATGHFMAAVPPGAPTPAGILRNLARVCTVGAKADIAAGQYAAAEAKLARARELHRQTGADQYDLELIDTEADMASRVGDHEEARQRWHWLFDRYFEAAHPRASIYLDRLSRLPLPRP